MIQLKQKHYSLIEIDQREKDIIQIWAQSKDGWQLVQLERENLDEFIKLLKP